MEFGKGRLGLGAILRVQDRLRRVRRIAFDRLELEVVMEDPKALAKPWSAKGFYELRPQWELGEISCSGDYLE